MSRNLRWYVSVMALPLALGLVWGVSDGGVVDKATAFGTLDGRLGLQRAASVAWNTERVDEDYIYSRGFDGRMDAYARSPLAQPPRAFPGVEGDGAIATVDCNRDTVHIIEVTSLSFEGDGTLDSAMAAAKVKPTRELKLIHFRTGGWTYSGNGSNSPSNLECTRVAGHTAPGGGIGKRSGARALSMSGWEDFVVRGITFAQDSNTDHSVGMVGASDSRDGVISDNTYLWWIEKAQEILNTDDSDSTVNITFAHNLMAQAQGENTALQATICDQGTGCNTGGRLTGTTFTRNVWHSIGWRLPQRSNANAGMDTSQVNTSRHVGELYVNSAVQAHLQVEGDLMIDVMDVYVMPGPSTNERYSWVASVFSRSEDANDDSVDVQLRLYADRLIGVRNRDTTTASGDLWHPSVSCGADAGNAEVASRYKDACDPEGGGNPRDFLGNQIERDTALSPAAVPISRINPFVLKDSLIGATSSDTGRSGAHLQVLDDGTMVLRADSALYALQQEVRDSSFTVTGNSGVTSSYVEAHEAYTKPTGTACTDSDGNRLCDDFENEHWGLTGQNPAGDPDGDGWVNGEEYENGTDPLVAEDAINLIPIIHHHRRPGSGPNPGRAH